MFEHKSMVAQFWEQTAREEESARLGLHGIAAVARHEAITCRMERDAVRFFGLLDEGREQEALAFMQSDGWCAEQEQEVTGEQK